MPPVSQPGSGSAPVTASRPSSGSHEGLRAVLFDMDGLVVDTEPLWMEVERGVLARLGSSWTHADQLAIVGGSLEKTVAYLLRRATRPAPPERVADWLIGGMAALLAQREIPVLPGVAKLFAEVREAGLPVALVTSSQRVIMEAVLARLAAIGIGFGVTVCGNDVRATKPDPEPYLRAAGLLGVDPAWCAVLEDSPSGVAAAEAAGCATVAVPSLVPIPDRPGRLVVRSLNEVSLATLRDLVSGVRTDSAIRSNFPFSGSRP